MLKFYQNIRIAAYVLIILNMLRRIVKKARKPAANTPKAAPVADYFKIPTPDDYPNIPIPDDLPVPKDLPESLAPMYRSIVWASDREILAKMCEEARKMKNNLRIY